MRISDIIGQHRRGMLTAFLLVAIEIATGVARTSFDRQQRVSQATARMQFSREYVHLLQYSFPEVVYQAIAVGGGLRQGWYPDES